MNKIYIYSTTLHLIGYLCTDQKSEEKEQIRNWSVRKQGVTLSMFL